MRYQIINSRTGEILGETEFLYQAKYRVEEMIQEFENPTDACRIKIYEGEMEIGHVVMVPKLLIDN